MLMMQQFHHIADDPMAYAVEWKQKKQRPVLGHFCTYTPEEIIYAADVLPFRLFGSAEAISRADSHLQAYSCSLVRGGLEEALSGKLDFLDGTVFPHTCDSIQRLSDIWRLNAGFSMHFDVVLPVQLHTASAKKYMTDVLKLFKKQLETQLRTEISDTKLQKSIALYNKSRKLIKEIYELRDKNPALLTGSDINAVLKCAMVMDRAEFTDMLHSLIKTLPAHAISQAEGQKKRVILAGGICTQPDIYRLLEECGIVVVWDELCTGTRYFEGEIELEEDLIHSIARRYYERLVCPAKHKDIYQRSSELTKIVKEHNAQGVIFMLLKFCDPHAFDYPHLKETMDQLGIPNLLLEIEETLPPEGQLRTRFETFSEML